MIETAMSTVKLLPETKDQIEVFARQLEQGLNDGQIIPSELLRFQKAMERVFEKIKPTLISATIDEVSQYEKDTIIKGTEFSIMEAGTKYDYSGCNDTELNDLYFNADLLKETIKERETFLKSLKGQLQLVDEETGDVHTIYPPKKTSTTTVKVTFK